MKTEKKTAVQVSCRSYIISQLGDDYGDFSDTCAVACRVAGQKKSETCFTVNVPGSKMSYWSKGLQHTLELWHWTYIYNTFVQTDDKTIAPSKIFSKHFFCFVFVISKTKRIISWTWFVPYSTLNIPYLQCHFPLVLQILARNASICCRAINHIDE